MSTMHWINGPWRGDSQFWQGRAVGIGFKTRSFRGVGQVSR